MAQTHVVLYSDDAPYSQSAHEFAGWLTDLLEDVAEEDRTKVQILFSTEESYGDARATISVEYWREETAEEAAKREAKERARMAAKQAEELRVLAALQAKYGVGSANK